MENKGRHIKVQNSEFMRKSFWSNRNRNLRSFENYLIKNNRVYDINDEVCIIYVNDKSDATKIGLEFQFKQLEYYDGSEFSIINLVDKNPRYSDSALLSIDDASEKGMTLRKFNKKAYEDISLSCIRKNEIVKRKILTKGRLDIAIKEGRLKQINVGSRSYINKQELADFINCKQDFFRFK